MAPARRVVAADKIAPIYLTWGPKSLVTDLTVYAVTG